MASPHTPPHSPTHEPSAPKSRTNNSRRLSPEGMKRAQASFLRSMSAIPPPPTIYTQPLILPATPPLSPKLQAVGTMDDDVEGLQLSSPIGSGLQRPISLKPSPPTSSVTPPRKVQLGGAAFILTPTSTPGSPMPRVLAEGRLKEMKNDGWGNSFSTLRSQ